MEVRSLSILITLALSAGLIGAKADDNAEKLANAMNAFSLNLYKELTKQEDNIFCSGYSFSVALNMLLVGARGNTASEIKSVLGYASENLSQEEIEENLLALLTEQRRNHTGYEFSIANSMWIQSGFRVFEDFKSTLKNKLYAEEKEVSFGTDEATDAINDWVKKETKGKITKLFDEVLDGLTRLVMVNAMYFKGTWKTMFSKDLTHDHPFYYKNNGQQTEKDIQMMNLFNEFQYAESDALNSQILELPYDGEEVSMVVILPNGEDNLSDMEQRLTVDNLSGALDSLSKNKVYVRMPKFEASSTFSLEDVLETLGMKDAFDQTRADLSGIDGTRELYVAKAIQKAVVEVSEEGTVAAAASGVVTVVRTISSDGPKTFFANRPFIYLIRHKPTGIIYFMGKFSKP